MGLRRCANTEGYLLFFLASPGAVSAMAEAPGSGPIVCGDLEMEHEGQVTDTGGQPEGEDQRPKPPAKAAPRPRPKTPAKKKAAKGGDVPLAQLVKADVKPYIKETEKPIPLDLLHLDAQQQYGQIRPLRAEEVDRMAAGMVENPPQSRLHAVVWEQDQQGIPSSLSRRLPESVALRHKEFSDHNFEVVCANAQRRTPLFCDSQNTVLFVYGSYPLACIMKKVPYKDCHGWALQSRPVAISCCFVLCPCSISL